MDLWTFQDSAKVCIKHLMHRKAEKKKMLKSKMLNSYFSEFHQNLHDTTTVKSISPFHNTKYVHKGQWPHIIIWKTRKPILNVNIHSMNICV